MTSTNKRKNFSTNLDKTLLRKLKIVSAEFEKNQNEILEEASVLVLSKAQDHLMKGNLIQIKESNNRKLKNTTIDRNIYKKLNVMKARTDINVNTLIEEGLRIVFKKYKSEFIKKAKML